MPVAPSEVDVRAGSDDVGGGIDGWVSDLVGGNENGGGSCWR